MINGAINQTLSRTALTSMTVFFVILCLFLFGGTVIHDFSFAMLIGVVTGSYSSVFVASPILIAYEDLRKKKQPQAKRASVQAVSAQITAKRGAAKDSSAQLARNPKKTKKQPAGQADAGKKVRG